MLFLITIPFFPGYYFPHRILTILSFWCPSTSLHLHVYFLSSNCLHSSSGNYRRVLQALNPYPILSPKRTLSLERMICHSTAVSHWWLPIATRIQSKAIRDHPSLSVFNLYLQIDLSQLPIAVPFYSIFFCKAGMYLCSYQHSLNPNLHIPHILLCLTPNYPIRISFMLNAQRNLFVSLKNK